MHIKGIPRTMQINPEYDDCTQEVFDFLQNKISPKVTATWETHRRPFSLDLGEWQRLQPISNSSAAERAFITMDPSKGGVSIMI